MIKKLSPTEATAALIRIVKDKTHHVVVSEIEDLIAQGADVNAKTSDKSEWSILMSATTRYADENTTALIQCLVNHDADIHYGIATSYSVLSRAAVSQGVDVIKILLNEQTSHSHLNEALKQSILNENPSVSDFFLSQGATITDSNEDLNEISILHASYQENVKLIDAILQHQLTSLTPQKTVEIATKKGLEFSRDELQNLYPYIIDSYVCTKITLLESQDDLSSFAKDYLQSPIIKKSLSQQTKLLLKLILNPSSLENTSSEHLLTLKHAIAHNEYFENNISAQHTALLECLQYPISEHSLNKTTLDHLEKRIKEEATYGTILSPNQRSALWEITNPEQERTLPHENPNSSNITQKSHSNASQERALNHNSPSSSIKAEAAEATEIRSQPSKSSARTS